MAKYLDSTGLTHLVQKLKTDVIPKVKVNAAAKADSASTAAVATKANSVDAANINGVIPISKIPQGALERVVTVPDDTARFKLTTSQVQLGDTVKVTSTGRMYIVIDESKLTSAAGYMEYAAGHAATADTATNASAVPWSGVTGKPSTFAPSAHNHTAKVTLGSASGNVSTSDPLTFTLKDIFGTLQSSGGGNAVTAVGVSGNVMTIYHNNNFSLSSHTHSVKIGKKDSLSFGTSKLSLSVADILGTAPTSSGSGNAITAISISGDTITATKGTTFAVASDVKTTTDALSGRIQTLEDFTGAAGAGGLYDQLNAAGYDVIIFDEQPQSAPATAALATSSLNAEATSIAIQGTYNSSTEEVAVAAIYARVAQQNVSTPYLYYKNWTDRNKYSASTNATTVKLYRHKIYVSAATGKLYYAKNDTTLKLIDGGDKALTNTEIDSAITAAG